jgi:PAS domain S-box-containing protein
MEAMKSFTALERTQLGFALFIGIVLLIIVLGISSVIKSRENVEVASSIQMRVRDIGGAMAQMLNSDLAIVNRLSQRSDLLNVTGTRFWKEDALSILETGVGFKEIHWLDNHLRVLQKVPLVPKLQNSVESWIDLWLSHPPPKERFFNQAHLSVQSDKIVFKDDKPREVLIAIAPIYRLKKHEGFIVAAISLDDILARVFPAFTLWGYQIEFWENGRRVFSQAPEALRRPLAQGFIQRKQFTFGDGLIYELSLNPTVDEVNRLRRHYSDIFLISGWIAILISIFAIRIWQKAKVREERLMKSWDHLDKTLDAARIGIWNLNLGDHSISFDQRMCELWGCVAEDAPRTVEAYLEAIHPKDRERVARELKNINQGGTHIESDFLLIRPDRQERFISCRGRVSQEEIFKPAQLVVIAWDLTESKALEESVRQKSQELKERNDMIEIAIRASLLGIWIWDILNNKLYWDDGMHQIFGTRPETFGGNLDSFVGFVHPEDQERVRNLVLDSAKKQTSYEAEYRAVRPDKSIRTLLAKGKTYFDESRNFGRMVGVCWDITERKIAEELIQSKEHQLEYFIEHTPAAVALFDRELKYLYFSDQWLIDFNLNLTREQLMGKFHYEVMKESSPDWSDILNHCLKGHIEKNPLFKLTRADGETLWLQWEAHPWYDSKGVLGGVFVFSTNVTSRIEAENSLKASLEEKEVLLREIHHRVKNNLNIIASLLDLQRRTLPTAKEKDAFLESKNRVVSMALIHEKLYQAGELYQIDFQNYLEDLISSIYQVYGFDRSEFLLEVNVGQLQLDIDTAIPCSLIINELVTNSLKHAFKGKSHGKITVRLNPTDHLNSKTEFFIEDNGIGLPSGFSLSESRSLGLKLVASLTKQLGGEVQTFVPEGGGTGFKLAFILNHRKEALCA